MPRGRMISTKHAMKWLLSLCGVSDGGWGNLADVRMNTFVVSGLKPMYPLPL